MMSAEGEQVLAARKVLVVEDDEAIAALICMVLKDQGVVVETARTGHDAIERAAQIQPDLVVLDLGLPGLYGTTVGTALRQADRRLPIIVVSALPVQTVAEDAWSIQAQGYLTKPFETDDLQALVQRFLPAAQPEASPPA